MKNPDLAVSVRIARDDEERQAAFRIRYEVYVEEMGWETEYADHESRLIEQPLDRSGEIWIALVDGKIVGTVRANFGSCSELGFYAQIYGLDSLQELPAAIGIFTNFVMLRPYRNLSIAMRLVRGVFAMAVRAGVHTALLDCEPRMARLYAWMGFEVHNPDFVHPQYGPGICMKMNLGNWTRRFLSPEPAMAV